MSNYWVTVIRVQRLKVLAYGKDKEDAKKHWRGGAIQELQDIENEVIDSQEVEREPLIP